MLVLLVAAGLSVADLSAAHDALEQGNWQAALTAFDAAALASPNDPEILRGRCSALSQLGRHEEAARSCQTAATLDASVATQLLLATVLVREKAPAGLEHAQALVATLLGHDVFADDEQRHRARFLDCEIALARRDAARFRSCVTALGNSYPTSPEALYFAHTGALSDRDLARARALLEQARRFGLPDDLYAASVDQIDAEEPPLVRWAYRAWHAFTRWARPRK